jgi:hypothetical protein
MEVSMSKKQGVKGRFSARKKSEAVLRLLRGEELDLLSRELGITAATLAEWREAFLAAGSANLKSRERDARDEEIAKLKAMVGEMTMRNEVLREGLRHAKGGLPLAPRRSKP